MKWAGHTLSPMQAKRLRHADGLDRRGNKGAANNIRGALRRELRAQARTAR